MTLTQLTQPEINLLSKLVKAKTGFVIEENMGGLQYNPVEWLGGDTLLALDLSENHGERYGIQFVSPNSEFFPCIWKEDNQWLYGDFTDPNANNVSFFTLEQLFNTISIELSQFCRDANEELS